MLSVYIQNPPRTQPPQRSPLPDPGMPKRATGPKTDSSTSGAARNPSAPPTPVRRPRRRGKFKLCRRRASHRRRERRSSGSSPDEPAHYVSQSTSRRRAVRIRACIPPAEHTTRRSSTWRTFPRRVAPGVAGPSTSTPPTPPFLTAHPRRQETRRKLAKSSPGSRKDRPRKSAEKRWRQRRTTAARSLALFIDPRLSRERLPASPPEVSLAGALCDLNYSRWCSTVWLPQRLARDSVTTTTSRRNSESKSRNSPSIQPRPYPIFPSTSIHFHPFFAARLRLLSGLEGRRRDFSGLGVVFLRVGGVGLGLPWRGRVLGPFGRILRNFEVFFEGFWGRGGVSWPLRRRPFWIRMEAVRGLFRRE